MWEDLQHQAVSMRMCGSRFWDSVGATAMLVKPALLRVYVRYDPTSMSAAERPRWAAQAPGLQKQPVRRRMPLRPAIFSTSLQCSSLSWFKSTETRLNYHLNEAAPVTVSPISLQIRPPKQSRNSREHHSTPRADKVQGEEEVGCRKEH